MYLLHFWNHVAFIKGSSMEWSFQEFEWQKRVSSLEPDEKKFQTLEYCLDCFDFFINKYDHKYFYLGFQQFNSF